MTFEELPLEWQQKIRQLRREAAKFRTERNAFRLALEALTRKARSNDGRRANRAQTNPRKRGNHK